MLPELISYTLLADKIIIDAFVAAGKPLPEAERIFSHVLNTQHIWTKRLLNEPADHERIDLHPAESFEPFHLQNSGLLLNIVHTCELAKQVIYTDSQGNDYINTVEDILFHVVNHSTYHRGQIAAQFRLEGVKPPITDFILLKREGFF